MARLIDADGFKRQVVAETARQGLKVEKSALLLALIDAQPTIDPVKRARWEMNPKKPYREYKCSDCGSLRKYKTKYCAACGARMDAEEENNGYHR